MRQILVISLRELTRLQKRFRDGVSLAATAIILLLLGASSFALRDSVSLGAGLYRVGVTSDAPAIRDSRFASLPVASLEEGQRLLEMSQVDILVTGAEVIQRQDERSQFAVRALKQYIEREEILRIGTEYPAESAFPLRVGINYLGRLGSGQAQPENARPEEIIIPSLTPPPAPFAQVLVAMIYIMPITFISIFFTTSFMDEKVNRRLTILLSAPITPFQIVMGKMLPYAIFALFTTALIAYFTNVNVLLALAIFAPTILFIFAIYLMVPMFYRTYKDITFIAMFVTTMTTSYLVFPAMFTNVNDLAYISPLALAVKMYRGEAFGWREYLFPSLPMTAIFVFSMYACTRLMNEEFLMGYRSIWRKITDAVYLLLAHIRPVIAVPLWSLLTIPVIYLAQIVFLTVATNLPFRLIIFATLGAAALVEEVIKSISITVLAEHGMETPARRVFGLAFLSALGFLVGEKLLLLLSLSYVSESTVAGALFGEGLFLLIPLFAHFVFTSIVTFMRIKLRLPYLVAIVVGTVVHLAYNLLVFRTLS